MMKNSIRIGRLALTTAACAVLLACGDGSATQPSDDPAFSATIDGATFVAGERESDFSLYDGGTRLFIAGAELRDSRITQVSIEVGNVSGAGTYTLDGSERTGFIITRDSSGGTSTTVTRWDVTAGDVGSLVISTFDTQQRRIAGSFSFRATTPAGAVAVVTNGSFNGRLFIDP